MVNAKAFPCFSNTNSWLFILLTVDIQFYQKKMIERGLLWLILPALAGLPIFKINMIPQYLLAYQGKLHLLHTAPLKFSKLHLS